MDNKLEHFPDNPTAQKMMGSITGNGFYDQSYVGKWLFQVMGLEMEDARNKVEELENQLFFPTADWGLGYHEEKYGLPSRGTIEERRQRIRKKITQTLPFNPELLRKNLAAISGLSPKEIIILENTAPYTFTIVFCENDYSGDGSRNAREYTLRVKPSHLHLEALRKYLSAAETDLRNTSGLAVRSNFFPRYNLEVLIMDGSWGLEGDYFLNGYKVGRKIEFYPARLHLASRAQVETKERQKIWILSDMPEETELGLGMKSLGRAAWKEKNESGMKLLSRFPKLMREESVAKTGSEASHPIFCCLQPVIRSPTVLDWKEQSAAQFQSKIPCMKRAILLTGGRSKIREKLRSGSTGKSLAKTPVKRQSVTRMYFRNGVSQKISCHLGLAVEKDLWFLNGQVPLNGSRKLDAEIFHYGL